MLLLIVAGSWWSCLNANDINGFNGCQCNFMDACNAQGNPWPNWDQYLPSGVDKFGYFVQGAQNLAYLCEDLAVATLFDSNSRIQLYSATVMTGQQLSASSEPRPTNHFRKSKNLARKYQQTADDYEKASQRELCLKKKATKTLEVDKKWASAAAKKKTAVKASSGKACLPVNPKAPIHKGHLIASQYGRGDKKRMLATFTFPNVVPQFGLFNSGPWQQCESSLILWGRKNCATGTDNAKLFIVVGAIPSTVSGASEARFFGKEGFSDYQDEEHYPVNVPGLMWTAACCSFEYKDVQGNLQTGIKSTAFSGENVPGGSKCDKIDVPSLSTVLSTQIHGNINLFPLTPKCYNNYIPL